MQGLDRANEAVEDRSTQSAVAAWQALMRQEEKATAGEVASSFLLALLELMDLSDSMTIHLEEDVESLSVSIEGSDCGLLIGRRGVTLQALQYILVLVVQRHAARRKFVELDVGGYHRRKRQRLVDMAQRTAQRVLETGQAFELSPMRPAERRVVHEALADYAGIVTYSEGQGRDRYVVIDLEEYQPEL